VRRESLARQILNVRGFRQIFVISHDDTFEQATQNLIRVERIVVMDEGLLEIAFTPFDRDNFMHRTVIIGGGDAAQEAQLIVGEVAAAARFDTGNEVAARQPIAIDGRARICINLQPLENFRGKFGGRPFIHIDKENPLGADGVQHGLPL
jgi:hypothetical protein